MSTILITACSNRKTVAKNDCLSAHDLLYGSLKEVARAWRGFLKNPRVTRTASTLYNGRGACEALKTASFLDAEHWIISAGLGLVKADENIPAYDLTISGSGSTCIKSKVLDDPFSSCGWWRELSRRRRPSRTIAHLSQTISNGLVILALPANYLDMVSEDLANVEPQKLESFRLIGPPYSRVPDFLKPCWMPYDTRLDGPSSPLRGTRTDFAQRAARHFAEVIWTHTKNTSIQEHFRLVNETLDQYGVSHIPKRTSFSDDALIKIIKTLWVRTEGRSNRMLRLLRDEELIACEQGRFKTLFYQAKQQLEQEMTTPKTLQLRALRTIQQKDTEVFAFFIPGELIAEIADISRIHRDDNDALLGFQRKAIKRHVKNIVEYLDEGNVLFPNSIILAFSPDVVFKQSRGREPADAIKAGQIGTLEIPFKKEGQRVAWVVDGQQRSLALSQAMQKGLNVPVVAFVAENLEVQREQFILVNKAKPLPSRLINELLPVVDIYLPKDLSIRKLPSELCDLLNKDPESPFYQMIKRISQDKNPTAVITDTAIIDMIKNSIKNPLGALSQYKSLGSEPSDTEGMYKTLVLYWSTVRDTFPKDWGKEPTNTRLMHSAGIHAMGVLMDKIVNRASGQEDPEQHIRESLRRLSPHCRWSSGTWEHLDMAWNEIQKVSKHLRLLSDLLNKLDYESSVQVMK